jgi:hypothetical protein
MARLPQGGVARRNAGRIGRACGLKREPKRYLFSLWLLDGMLLDRMISGAAGRVFVVWIVVVIGWFALCAVALLMVELARVADLFWRWFARGGRE